MDNLAEVFRIQILMRIQTTAGQQHISNTVMHQYMKYRQAFFFAQFFQQTALHTIHQFRIIAIQVVHDQILCGLQQNISEITTCDFSKVFHKLLSNSCLMAFIHLPDRNRACISTLMCVGNIEIILEIIPLAIVRKHSDTLASSIHPSLELPIPCFQRRHGSCIRTLYMD
ncbi:MAG: hypothetical protein SPE35_07170 [Butyricicoccus sp.]|nr:hypothetical protein [Butyricicoccus sp.]